jgi:hypothetical protein
MPRGLENKLDVFILVRRPVTCYKLSSFRIFFLNRQARLRKESRKLVHSVGWLIIS